jgi:hypothetical protein
MEHGVQDSGCNRWRLPTPDAKDNCDLQVLPEEMRGFSPILPCRSELIVLPLDAPLRAPKGETRCRFHDRLF